MDSWTETAFKARWSTSTLLNTLVINDLPPLSRGSIKIHSTGYGLRNTALVFPARNTPRTSVRPETLTTVTHGVWAVLVRLVDMDSTSLRAWMITMVVTLLVFTTANSSVRSSKPLVVLQTTTSSVMSSEPRAVPSLMHSGCVVVSIRSSRRTYMLPNRHISAALVAVAAWRIPHLRALRVWDGRHQPSSRCHEIVVCFCRKSKLIPFVEGKKIRLLVEGFVSIIIFKLGN